MANDALIYGVDPKTGKPVSLSRELIQQRVANIDAESAAANKKLDADVRNAKMRSDERLAYVDTIVKARETLFIIKKAEWEASTDQNKGPFVPPSDEGVTAYADTLWKASAAAIPGGAAPTGGGRFKTATQADMQYTYDAFKQAAGRNPTPGELEDALNAAGFTANVQVS
jgi:hypothetical protein